MSRGALQSAYSASSHRLLGLANRHWISVKDLCMSHCSCRSVSAALMFQYGNEDEAGLARALLFLMWV
eukprot:2637687-Amphidinium_carterae.1